MAYVTNRNGGQEIWLHKEGQPDRPIVTARDFPPDTFRGFMNPSLSPDGSRVIYTHLELAGPARLWMSSVSGGVPVPLLKNAAGGGGYGTSWSPDGNWFVFWWTEDGKTLLKKVKTTGQAEPETLKADVTRKGTSSMLPVWSPTGEWILHYDDGVKLTSPDGTTTREISAAGAVVCAFSADGKSIFGIRRAASNDRLELFSVSVGGGPEKLVGSLSLDYLPATSANPSGRLSLAPDGKSVTYSILKSASNLWLMEGLNTVPHP